MREAFELRDWRGWAVFGLWAVGAGLLLFSVLGALSIGLFMLPLALVVLFVALARPPLWPEVLGAGVGLGAVALAVAAAGHGGRSWSFAAAILVVGGACAYVLARRGSARPALRPTRAELVWLAAALVVAVIGVFALVGGGSSEEESGEPSPVAPP